MITFQVEYDLRNDSPQLAAGSCETMSSGTISSWEHFPRYNEGGDIWAKVLEKVCKAEKEHQKFGFPVRVCELLKFKT